MSYERTAGVIGERDAPLYYEDVGGGYVGGALGLYSFTEVGAAIGAPFGPGGMIVVGFIGATLGSIVGSYCATQITDRCYGY